MTIQIMRYAIIGVLHGRHYLSVWNIAERLNVPPEQFGSAGTPGEWNDVLLELVSDGIIEEVPELHYRYRLTGK